MSTTRTVLITLAGLEYQLCYDLGALRFLRDTYSLTLGDYESLEQDPVKLSEWVHAGLRRHHPDVTLDMVDAAIGFDQILDVFKAVDQALTFGGANDVPPAGTAASQEPETSTGSPPNVGPTVSAG